jgi:hypothetical protein
MRDIKIKNLLVLVPFIILSLRGMKFSRPMAFFGYSRSRIATLSKVMASVALAGAGGWQLWTRQCYFEPFGPENDPIFQSDHYKRLNPGNHPSLKDSCVRRVPLSQISPELVDDTLKGGSKLVERFCAGIWGGYGE